MIPYTLTACQLVQHSLYTRRRYMLYSQSVRDQEFGLEQKRGLTPKMCGRLQIPTATTRLSAEYKWGDRDHREHKHSLGGGSA